MSNHSAFNPFVGLRPFESEDSLYYFGRNTQTKTLLRKLHEHHFVAVVGSSGSGKSSLIRAGVIPQLEAGFLVQDRDQWQIARMKPGEAPLQHLVNELIAISPVGRVSDSATRQESLITAIQEQGAQALLDHLEEQLKDTDNNLFILVDQFEELFRFGNDGQKEGNTDKSKQQQAAEFVALLLNLSQQKQLPIYVCLTMRSDFLGDCDAFKGLPEAINTSQFLVPRLTRSQRREVITNPVHLAGVKISSRLVDKLLNEDIHTRDDLPVLQHVLMRTFDAWQQSGDAAAGKQIDVQHYEQVYTIHKALDHHANEALEELNSEQQAIAKKLFQSLTTVDAGNRRIRRPAHLDEVCAIANATPQQVMEVIQCFRRDNRSFLVLSSEHADDNPLIDISHESLIRQWAQLAEWVDTEANSAKTYRRLAETALLQQKGLANYYRDLDLEQALVWQQETQPTEEWSKRYNKHFTAAIDFLEKSQLDDQHRKDKELAEQKKRQQLLKDKAELKEQQVQQQRKALVKSRWLSGIMAMLALAMLVIASVALDLSGKADQAKELAEQNAKMAEVEKERAVKNEAEAKHAKDDALAATEETKEKILEANFYLAKSYEQKAMFALSKGDQAQQKGRNKSLIEYRKAWLYALEAEKLELPEEKIALKQSSLVQLTNILSRHISTEKKVSPAPPNIGSSTSALAYSPDGSVLASAGTDQTVRLWDAKSGELKQSLSGHKGSIWALAYSADGSVLASAGDDGKVRLWDAKSGELKQGLSGYQGRISALVYSVDGSVLASAGDGTVRLWDAQRGELKQSLSGHEGNISALAYSADGSVLASAGSDEKVRLWDAQRGELKQSLNGHEGWIYALAYSADDSVLASAGDDGIVRLWDAQSGELKQSLSGHERWISALAYSADGSVLASAGSDGKVRLWDAQIGDLKQSLNGHEGGISALAYSADGSMLASAGSDGKVRLWDAQSGDLKQSLNGHEGGISALAYSADGSVLASAGSDKTVRLWDAKSGELKQSLSGHTGTVSALAYSADGSVLASAGSDKTVRLWDDNQFTTLKLFYELDPEQVSDALKFIWEMGLDTEEFEFVHKIRKPILYPREGYYYHDVQYRPLLDMPKPGESKMQQLVRWLEGQCAYKNKSKAEACKKQQQ